MSEDTSKSTLQSANDTGASPASEGTLRNFAELEQHFERIKKLHSQTAQREAELEKMAGEVQRRTKDLDGRSAELDAWAQQIDAERTSVENQRREVDDARKELDQKLADLQAAQQKIDGDTAELTRGREESAALASKLDTMRAELESRAESLSQREKGVASAEQRVAEQEQALAAAQTKLSQERMAMACDRQKLDAEQREVESTQARLATMMKAVQARAAELEDREKSLVAREKYAQNGAAAAKEVERAEEEVKKLEATLAERTSLISTRDAEIAQLRNETERLSNEVIAAQNQAKAAASAAAAASASQIEKTEKTGADVKGRADLEAELEKSRRAIELLAEKLRTAQKETEQLKKKATESPARRAATPQPSTDGRIHTDPHNILRRKRLQRYKAILQSQARKIMSAQAALTKRQTEADMILAHRSKLATAAEHIRAREAKINSQRAKSAGAMIAFSFAATTAAIGAISWFAAVRFAPATYLVSATVEAESRSRKPSETDLEGWQFYHTDLVADPQLIGQAAERLARRGVDSYSTPAALQAHLKNTLAVESSRDGELTLHLRGGNAQQTATVLDTYVTALAAAANLTRVQRPDGLVTEITSPVKVPDQPVADQRIVYAASIFGGGMFLSLMLGTITCQRIGRARRRAESDDAMSEFLAAENWPKPQA